MFEEAVAQRYSEQKMRCPVHLSIGQEWIAVALGQLLKQTDQVFSSHRAHAHYLAKGGCMKALLAEFYGKATGCSGGIGGSMHLLDRTAGFLGSVPILGSTIPIAAGFAFGQQLQGKRGQITVVFFGDGATEEGIFYESVNFAALRQLPIIFVCENNQLSVSTDQTWRRSPQTDLMKIMAGFDVKAYRETKKDCLNLFETLAPLLAAMREDSHPLYLEIVTERYVEHCGPKIQRDKSGDHWYGDQDPLFQLKKGISETSYLSVKSTIAREIEEAFHFAEQSPFPNAMEIPDET